MITFKTKLAADRFAMEKTGKLTNTSKMPCNSYGIPARFCKVGMKLRAIEGSTCASCYAFKGRYPMGNVQRAMQRRFDSLNDLDWVDNMTAVINHNEKECFRWHDSGDLQDLKHLRNIVQIARNLPHIMFWLPTREYGMVRQWISEGGRVPKNLNIRLSAHMVGETCGTQIKGCTYSTVDTAGGFDCKAPSQNGECRDCRACWDKRVASVNYHKH